MVTKCSTVVYYSVYKETLKLHGFSTRENCTELVVEVCAHTADRGGRVVSARITTVVFSAF
jgi:hypothetical protein